MSEEDTVRVSRAFYEYANSNEQERLTEILSPTLVYEGDFLPEPMRDPQAVVAMEKGFSAAIPDRKFEIEQEIVSGDRVATTWRFSGTHQGELMGVAATNRRLEFHGCTVAEVRDGKITHVWDYIDMATILRQIGVDPLAGAKG